jgi:hypothetical protein
MRGVGSGNRCIEQAAQRCPLRRETHRHGAIQPKLSSLRTDGLYSQPTQPL